MVVLLDISRTISRAPYPHPTGIDRVERAYIQHFLNAPEPAWFLSRVLKGYALLDKPAMQALWPMITGEANWQKPDLIAKLISHKVPEAVNRAESTLRRVAKGVCLRAGLSKMLRKNLPVGFTYLNVGHSNRKAALWRSISQAGAGLKLAMVHDVIPLDYPEFTRPDTALRFEAELKATSEACEALIFNSQDTAARTGVWLQKWGHNPASWPIWLGVDPLGVPELKPLAEPAQFVILGTIEPRKNHQLLMDIWADIPAELHIIGQRGWLNKAVFAKLDNSDLVGKTIFEHNNLNDTALAARLSSARALLFPSFAEGFGYPIIEALQMGLPVICSDLPCFREIAAELPLYLPADDKQAWKAAILAAVGTPRDKIPENVEFPTWEQHFAKLNKFIYSHKKPSEQQAGK